MVSYNCVTGEMVLSADLTSFKDHTILVGYNCVMREMVLSPALTSLNDLIIVVRYNCVTEGGGRWFFLLI